MVSGICIVGKSNSGKTTLIVKIIEELKKRGYKVATLKHHSHHSHLDQPGKDTWKHYHAGAEQVMISSPGGYAIYKRVKKELTIDELLNHNKEMDIVLIEGYKRANMPKIEIVRKERSTEMICSPNEVLAVVSDISFDIGKPLFDINDYLSISDFIEERIIQGRLSHEK